MKRTLLCVLAFILPLFFLVDCNKPDNSNLATNPGSNWWMPKGHYYKKSYHPGTQFEPPLVEKWHQDYQFPTQIINAPVFGANKIIFQNNNSGNSDKILRAISTQDGSTLWTFPSPDMAWNGAVTANGKVYFCGTHSQTAKLYSVNESDGTLNWSVVLPTLLNNEPYTLNSSMIIANGYIYLQVQSFSTQHLAVFIMDQFSGAFIRRLDFNL